MYRVFTKKNKRLPQRVEKLTNSTSFCLKISILIAWGLMILSVHSPYLSGRVSSISNYARKRINREKLQHKCCFDYLLSSQVVDYSKEKIDSSSSFRFWWKNNTKVGENHHFLSFHSSSIIISHALQTHFKLNRRATSFHNVS